MSTAVLTDTTFSMSFDFTSAAQEAVLAQLQSENFTLLAYKGATGQGQVTAGLPTWFSVPFADIAGTVTIDYTPQYKIYVFNQATIAAGTTIAMESLSQSIGLGTALDYSENGKFTTAVNPSPDGTVTLNNLRPGSTSDITVGLAGQVLLQGVPQFLPFCAFTLPPQNSVTMAPIEKVALMAARVGLTSGSVQADSSAPGCSFIFDSGDIAYQLTVTPHTFAITNVPGTAGVTAFPSSQALSFLNG